MVAKKQYQLKSLQYSGDSDVIVVVNTRSDVLYFLEMQQRQSATGVIST